MAEQGEDKGAAADVARQGRYGERPEEVGPGDGAIKDQVEDLYRAHHDMGGVRQRNDPGHQDNHHDLR